MEEHEEGHHVLSGVEHVCRLCHQTEQAVEEGGGVFDLRILFFIIKLMRLKEI